MNLVQISDANSVSNLENCNGKNFRISPVIKEEPKEKCKFCENSFTTEQELNDHVSEVHKFLCLLCNSGFQSKNTLEKHTEIVHLKKLPQNDGGKIQIFTCTNCDTNFPTEIGLNEHFSKEHVKKEEVTENNLIKGMKLKKGCNQIHNPTIELTVDGIQTHNVVFIIDADIL